MSLMLTTDEHHLAERAKEARKRGCGACVYWEENLQGATYAKGRRPGICHFPAPEFAEDGSAEPSERWWCSQWLPNDAIHGSTV